MPWFSVLLDLFSDVIILVELIILSCFVVRYFHEVLTFAVFKRFVKGVASKAETHLFFISFKLYFLI